MFSGGLNISFARSNMQLTVDLHIIMCNEIPTVLPNGKGKKKALGKFRAIHTSIFRKIYTRVCRGVQTIVRFEWIINGVDILFIHAQKGSVVSTISLTEQKSCQFSPDENTNQFFFFLTLWMGLTIERGEWWIVIEHVNRTLPWVIRDRTGHLTTEDLLLWSVSCTHKRIIGFFGDL